MQCIVPFFLLCLVVLQQTINVVSMISFEQNPSYEVKRLPTTRRLRAPLMGRSITKILDDDVDIIPNQSNGFNASDENELIYLNKRRNGLALLSRRKWLPFKRRGPLFG